MELPGESFCKRRCSDLEERSIFQINSKNNKYNIHWYFKIYLHDSTLFRERTCSGTLAYSAIQGDLACVSIRVSGMDRIWHHANLTPGLEMVANFHEFFRVDQRTEALPQEGENVFASFVSPLSSLGFI
jgi:hypothetical protein